jgi:hypothetical protein
MARHFDDRSHHFGLATDPNQSTRRCNRLAPRDKGIARLRLNV